jgi:hypothetical protein
VGLDTAGFIKKGDSLIALERIINNFGTYDKKVKLSLLQAVEALRVARGRGSHIT